MGSIHWKIDEEIVYTFFSAIEGYIARENPICLQVEYLNWKKNENENENKWYTYKQIMDAIACRVVKTHTYNNLL